MALRAMVRMTGWLQAGYRHPPERGRRSAVAASVLVCVAVAGCAGLPSSSPSPAETGAAATPSRQLMVKLKGASEPCGANRIAMLARATGQTLHFVRPMSGNACVIRQEAPTAKALADGFRRLVQHPSIDWVEVDGTMTAF